MEVAKLILEYLKILMWPLVTLFLVLRFKSPLSNILTAIGNKLATSEKIKVGLLGQEVELSGTAKELKEEQIRLLETDTHDSGTRAKAEKLKQAIPELNNPITDLVGISLLKDAKYGLSADDILAEVIKAFMPQSQPKAEKIDSTKLVLLSMSREVDKILEQLVNLQLVNKQGVRFVLTSDGNQLFTKVANRQNLLMKKFITH